MNNDSFPISHRARITKPSALATIVAEAEKLRAEGRELIDLGAGEPDFNTPDHIKAAATRAMAENFTRYTATPGMIPLRRALVETINRDFGSDYTPENCCVVAGGKQGIFNGVMALVDRGDDVLLERPWWVSFPEIVSFAEGKVVPIDTEATDFHLTADMVREAITPASKLLILNSPSNPTGRVMAPDEFRKIIELAAARNIWVISDECYLHFVYPPGRPYSAAALPPELRARVLIVGSFSKTWAMTGWRLGYALGAKEWVREVTKISTQSTSGANSIAQKAALAALTGSQDSVGEMLAEYQRRAQWLAPALNAIPGIRCSMPEGAFYAFPDVRELMRNCGIADSAALQRTLLHDYGVVLSAGSAFGLEGYLRLSYANSLENIQRAVDRIRQLREDLDGRKSASSEA
ncbi:MAG: pyridoxal phosphate-dependent aminotransferase [Blastocatellia bacterium]